MHIDTFGLFGIEIDNDTECRRHIDRLGQFDGVPGRIAPFEQRIWKLHFLDSLIIPIGQGDFKLFLRRLRGTVAGAINPDGHDLAFFFAFKSNHMGTAGDTGLPG